MEKYIGESISIYTLLYVLVNTKSYSPGKINNISLLATNYKNVQIFMTYNFKMKTCTSCQPMHSGAPFS
jgi:hypothetical protein